MLNIRRVYLTIWQKLTSGYATLNLNSTMSFLGFINYLSFCPVLHHRRLGSCGANCYRSYWLPLHRKGQLPHLIIQEINHVNV